MLTCVDVHRVVENYREHHRERRIDHNEQPRGGRQIVDRFRISESQIKSDKDSKIQQEHNRDAEPLRSLKKITSEINDYRNYREQEAVCAALQADIVSGDDGVDRYFQDNTYIRRHDESEVTQDKAEDINDNTQDIKEEQRHYARRSHKYQQSGMHKTHNSYRKREAVLDQKFEYSTKCIQSLLNCRVVHISNYTQQN